MRIVYACSFEYKSIGILEIYDLLINLNGVDAVCYLLEDLSSLWKISKISWSVFLA